eukprot:CAMPEP_0194336288 /NCGR_PEP_ID=MMETSP0171-20130528/72411_1 /TAXON_ID=218684 /ORGANISM="Corethron pennatum, Strain L29A3" /LENGTH=181 /DNA_ID=CAMNT_0039099675 /DNA_START=125 /DNA_END=667 /DNA_ORIENTATION=-
MTPFHRNLHIGYITSLADRIDRPDSYEGAVTDHLRMSGVYWSLTGLSIVCGQEDGVGDDGAPPAAGRRSRLDSLMGITKELERPTPPEPPSAGPPARRPSRPSVVDFVFACYDPSSGGFAGNVGHDPHLLYTLSALQILVLAGALDDARLDRRATAAFVDGLWVAADGSFRGDEWGEIDTR